MNVVIRAAATLISGVAIFYFLFWVCAGLTLSLNTPLWMVNLGSFLVAALVTWYVWTHSASTQTGLASSVLLWALVVGGVGFSAGFFGPLLFPPSTGANAGPMLGIFITGPLGFILGAVGGFVRWCARERTTQ